jgi:hypothetical protein
MTTSNLAHVLGQCLSRCLGAILLLASKLVVCIFTLKILAFVGCTEFLVLLMLPASVHRTAVDAFKDSEVKFAL